jgi:hypothetical protein
VLFTAKEPEESQLGRPQDPIPDAPVPERLSGNGLHFSYTAKTLEQWQMRAELGRSPRTIIEEMARIASTDVVLPIESDGQRELRLRCVVRPDKMQAALIDRLGLRIPERLKIASSEVRM